MDISATLVKGHQIASGNNPDSPYPAGSIALQLPLFESLGLDVSDLYPATLNLSIAPYRLKSQHPDYRFEQLQWLDGFPAETFSFYRCALRHRQYQYQGWVYYPHPETKPRDFQPVDVIEVLSPFVNNIRYGDQLTLSISDQHISASRTF